MSAKPTSEAMAEIAERDVLFVGAQFLARIDVIEQALSALHFLPGRSEMILKRIQDDLRELSILVLDKMPGGSGPEREELRKTLVAESPHPATLADAGDAVRVVEAIRHEQNALLTILNRQNHDGICTIGEADLRQGMRLLDDALVAARRLLDASK